MITRMPPSSKRRKWGIAAALLLAAVALYHPLSNLIYAARLALVLQRQASGATGEKFAVTEMKVRRQAGNLSYEALIYFPEKKPATRALILVAGLSELGCYHPSLVAFSRLMANAGFLVVTPDIEMFREFQISAEPIGQILFWHNQVGSLEGSQRVEKTGLGGISFSGTLILMAAAKPEIRDRVAFVFGIGPYSNLVRCSRDWFAPGPVTVSEGYYPTRFYAKWIVMLGALNLLPAAEDRLFLRSVLNALLLQKQVPQPAPGMTAEGARWYRLATLRQDQSDPELSRQIEEYLFLSVYHELDPEDSLGRLRGPVFLLHGAYDDLIPPSESMELHRRIPRSYLLISPFLTHTHPSEKRLSLWQKAKAVFEAVVFCYQLARVIR